MAPENKRRSYAATNMRRSQSSKRMNRQKRKEDVEQEDVAVDGMNVDNKADAVEEDSATESGTDYENDDGENKKPRRIVAGKSSDISHYPDSDRRLKVDKAAMAFPKGTFVVRLMDVGDNDCKWIWRIDNHQLIHKYILEEPGVIHQLGSSQRYVKSFRYSGWFCNEAWNFVELNVINREDNDERVEVEFPTEFALEAARNLAMEENRKRQITSASG